MRPRRPVVHHGAVALSSGSLYQARPALQSIPHYRPCAGAIKKERNTAKRSAMHLLTNVGRGARIGELLFFLMVNAQW